MPSRYHYAEVQAVAPWQHGVNMGWQRIYMVDLADLEDCARFLAEKASEDGKGPLAINTIDDCLIRNGNGAAAALRKAFDRLEPPDTPVSAAIRAELDRHTR